MSLRFHPLARAELLTAARRYEGLRAGLGESLLDEVYALAGGLMAMAGAAPEITPGIRKKSMRHFPYSIVYESKDGSLKIWAVPHHRRKPGYWLERIRDQRIQEPDNPPY